MLKLILNSYVWQLMTTQISFVLKKDKIALLVYKCLNSLLYYWLEHSNLIYYITTWGSNPQLV